jgi:hypothetical protein
LRSNLGASPSSSFFSLPGVTLAMRKSPTAAAMITTSLSAARPLVASPISAAVPTRTASTPSGTGCAVGPETSVTAAPRAAAARATA